MWTGMNTRSDIAAGESIGLAVGAWPSPGPEATTRMPSSAARSRRSLGAGRPAGSPRAPSPEDPLAGTWTPWLMTSRLPVRPAPPPAFRSDAWQHEVDEVVGGPGDPDRQPVRERAVLGRRLRHRHARGALAPDRDGPRCSRRGCPRRGRHERWPISASRRPTRSSPRWDAKYTYWTGRPVGLIPDFASAVITPNLPSYSSAHATVAAAASTVLAQFFPKDAGSLDATAEAAAASRLYGGTNWPADIEAGLRQGRQVGHLAVSRLSADGL